jgi:diguanylate cyclase (GGDEF)-like protein/PAS domain S-box-containing protein
MEDSMDNSRRQVEDLRLKAVHQFEVLDTPPESDFDDLVKLAAMIFNVPISTVTIVDEHRQWFKAAVGLPVRETARDISFCTHAIELEQPLVVENTALDPRFSGNPLVLGAPNLGFYAGIPLRTREDFAIGTFCIMDQKPRPFTKDKLEILRVLANQAMKLLELRSERIKLRESEQRWKFALEGAGDGVWDWNIETGDTVFSKQWKMMLGYTEAEIDNSYASWQALVHPDDKKNLLTQLNNYLEQKIDAYQVEHRLLTKRGDWKWVLTRGMVVARDSKGMPSRMVGTHTDISAHKSNEEVIWKQANFDSLTGLPNRRMFFDRLKEEIKRSSRYNKKFALLFIDLDGFKQVNDTQGHAAGDKLLKSVSSRIAETIRQTDTLARLGGDEFTAILSGVDDIKQVAAISDKLLERLSGPFRIGKTMTCISASIGISIYPNDGQDADSLMNLADTEMYRAKEQGKNRWSYQVKT